MIRSTFAGLTTAQLGMAASQRSIDVTGQNIANLNTEGYTRQRLDIASLNMRNGSIYNSSNSARVGYGVDITGISQLRDPFLDAQYRSQIAKLGTTDAHAAGLEKLQVSFDESTTSGIRDAFINLSNALHTLSKPDGYTKENDTVVRSRMQIIVNLLREKAVNLQDIRTDAQENFQSTDIKDLNGTLKNIAELNTSIKNSQILGNPALELMDERNRLLDELGSYLPINVTYKQKNIGEGYSVQVMKVSFTDSDGLTHNLIDDGRYGQFRTDISDQPVTLSLTDADGFTNDFTDKLTDGTLKGTLDFLNKSGDFDDTDFKGIGYYEKVLDSLVEKFVTEFNNANAATVQESVTAGGKDYFKFTDPATGNTIYKDENDKYYTDDPAVTTPPVTEFTGDPKTLKPVYSPNKEDRPLFEEIEPGKGFTALNVKVATGWLEGSYGITNSNNTVNGVIGSTASENIENMINMLSKEYAFSSDSITKPGMDVRFYTGTFYSCFANIESTLGIDLSSMSTTLDNQITVLNQTANSRDGISGVQLDEEGMNLLHYNQSYSAAARLMTTLDEMLDKLINGTGVVGR
ncbi:MAG: flagellar basal body protein [Schaedlerella sp.]|uniref:flagellar hook-associated protein FlgK n=1 Tax=Schaedlerella sp. TaxID=2676057 RepID=UPI003527C506